MKKDNMENLEETIREYLDRSARLSARLGGEAREDLHGKIFVYINSLGGLYNPLRQSYLKYFFAKEKHYIEVLNGRERSRN